ncbi:aldose 1-epimerase [Acidocella sp.]|uniref:aldose 1-epimerase n=1 Tax=Acidocella sp. TaxID=50710 RepID=UPI00260B0FA3|nr:aldose 1-epimerase [Acidocella sp.]
MDLTNGPLRLRLAPETGGAIHGWWHEGRALLRETPPDGADVRDHASFPLIPFSNRIARGQFRFGGEAFTLPRDPRDPRHALHGNALYARWQVARAGPASALLSLTYRPDLPQTPFFPFAYTAWQRYTLSPTGLSIGLCLRNDDKRPFPAGLGHHLYFPRTLSTRLRFWAAGHWETGTDGLPSRRSTTWRDEFAQGAALAGARFDNGFYGWARQVEITEAAAGYGLRLRASAALAHAVLYVPETHAYFAFEPVSHGIDAINREGMRVLAPGACLRGGIICTISASPAGA